MSYRTFKKGIAMLLIALFVVTFTVISAYGANSPVTKLKTTSKDSTNTLSSSMTRLYYNGGYYYPYPHFRHYHRQFYRYHRWWY